MIALLMKLLPTVWPFLREMFVGKKGTAIYISRNKATVVSILLNIMQAIVICFLLDIIIGLSTDFNEHKETTNKAINEFKTKNAVDEHKLEQQEIELSFLRQKQFGTDTHKDPKENPSLEDLNSRFNRLNKKE